MLFHRKGNMVSGIAFDCGTSSVRASLFLYEKKGPTAKPTVLQVIRAPFETTAYMDAHLLRRRTQEGMRYIIKEIPRAFHPAEILVGLSSPFYISKTTGVTAHREHIDQPITAKELQELITHTQDTFKQDARKQISNDDVLLFNSRVLKTFINGYRVLDPVGMDGKIIELHVHFEATAKNVFTHLTDLLRDRFSSATISVSSVTLATFYTLSTLFDAENGFLTVDVGGEVSDISLTVYGVLERIITLPLGTNFFLRQVAAVLGVSFSDASFIVRRYAEHTLDDAQQKRLMPVIEEFKKIWQTQLLTICNLFATQYQIPSTILFTGGGELPLHQEIFSEQALNLHIPQKNLVQHSIPPSLLDTSFVKHQFAGPSDFGLASLTLLNARGVL